MTDDAPRYIETNQDVAIDLLFAVREGDVDKVRRLLEADPELAKARLGSPEGGWKSTLHLTADWPGYWPRGAEMVHLLADAGADLNLPPVASDPDEWAETPLHWAASNDDVEVAAALIDRGADINRLGGSIAGTPLANAVGYGCWEVARLLVARGARPTRMWEAAALGDRDAVDQFMGADPPPTPDELGAAFWQACSGGQRRMAEYLLDRGADINYVPDYAGDQEPCSAALGYGTQRQILADWLTERRAATAPSDEEPTAN
jgi:hypothetical protein